METKQISINKETKIEIQKNNSWPHNTYMIINKFTNINNNIY